MRSVIACVQLPRFELMIAAGADRSAVVGQPMALAPEPGREPLIGEASASAEGYGVRGGQRLGEALARCPGLRLIPPDPAGVADAHHELLGRLESIGAAVESGRPGLAWFDARALRHLHGGPEAVASAARKAVRLPARVGIAPTRFAALAAAARARPRRTEVLSGKPPADASVDLLALLADGAGGDFAALAALVEPLGRFGVRTLGELAALPRAAIADRFGAPGLLARDLARGKDSPLRPREVVERMEEALELPESASGPQLERALGMLIDRLLARPERRGRGLRAAVVSARLVEGGTWRERLVFRAPVTDPERMRLVLVPKLASLPAPAELLRLRAEGFGPATGAQGALVEEPSAARAGRLREAIRQTRAAAGPEAALRVLEVDPDSRVPERRMALVPWDA
jgi:protein ImuB